MGIIRKQISENIAKELISHLKPMLNYELKNNSELDSVYIYTSNNYFKIFIFYNKKNVEMQNKILELIDNYIFNFIDHKLDYGTFLPDFMIKKIRKYIGCNKELIYFNFECLPKAIIKKIDNYANSIIPEIDIKYFPSELKTILPPMAIKIDD